MPDKLDKLEDAIVVVLKKNEPDMLRWSEIVGSLWNTFRFRYKNEKCLGVAVSAKLKLLVAEEKIKLEDGYYGMPLARLPKNISKSHSAEVSGANSSVFAFQNNGATASSSVLGPFIGMAENWVHGLPVKGWSPPPKVDFFVIQERPPTKVYLPTVAFNLINRSPYQLVIRIEVHAFLGKKSLGLVKDDEGYYDGTARILAEPDGGGFANGCFTLPDECANSLEKLTVEVKALIGDQNDSSKEEYIIIRSWTYDRKNNSWFYEPKAYADI